MGFLYWLNPINWFRKRTPAAKPAASTTPAAPAAPSSAPAATAKASAPKAAAKKAAPKAADKSYQDQCAALTSSGDQCRNSSRAGSKYCGSHKGYQPPSTGGVQAKKDTKPAVKKAGDTLPGKGSTATKGGKQAQCAAVTAGGKQCQNSSRAGSKYCGAHKGYKHATGASKVKKADTKPRHAGAKDTKPAVRKSKK